MLIQKDFFHIWTFWPRASLSRSYKLLWWVFPFIWNKYKKSQILTCNYLQWRAMTCNDMKWHEMTWNDLQIPAITCNDLQKHAKECWLAMTCKNMQRLLTCNDLQRLLTCNHLQRLLTCNHLQNHTVRSKLAVMDFLKSC